MTAQEHVHGPLCLPLYIPMHLFTLEIDSRHLIILKKDNPRLLMGQEQVGDRMSAGRTKLSIYPTVSIILCKRQK